MNNKELGGVGLAFVGFAVIILGFKGTWSKVFHDLWANAPGGGSSSSSSLQQSQQNAQSQGGSLQAPGPPPVSTGPPGPGDASYIPPGYPSTATAFTNNIAPTGVTV